MAQMSKSHMLYAFIFLAFLGLLSFISPLLAKIPIVGLQSVAMQWIVAVIVAYVVVTLFQDAVGVRLLWGGELWGTLITSIIIVVIAVLAAQFGLGTLPQAFSLMSLG